MSDDLFSRADPLLRAALDLPARDRAPFLDRECGGDAPLRSLLRRLLSSAEETGELPTGGALPPGLAADSPDRVGSRLDRYLLRREIGRGGMGVVYEAHDERLQRDVAVKVLRSDLLDRNAKARFLREARAAAALNHPNIVAVHDAGEADDVAYLVMELAPGRGLDEDPPRSLEEAMQVAGAICEALTHAHQRGLVHRDLKPANVIVARESGPPAVKLTDLGIALSADADRMTRTGTVTGTPSFMAPEQALGKALDGRADLYALGVMLYGWAAGQLPFRGRDALAVVSQHVHAEVVPPSRHAADVPPALDDLIVRLMSKRPEDRPGSAETVGQELAAILAGTSLPPDVTRPVAALSGAEARPPSVDSLAVLPFENDGRDPDSEYLSDGLTDSLIDNLSQVPRLRVMARSTVFQYKDRPAAPRDIGTELGVRAVLSGRLLHRGDALVIRVELVDAASGTRLWGRRFDRPLRDLLTVEEEISREITENLRIELSGADRARLARRPTENADAHRTYLKGRHVWNRWKTPEGMHTSIGLFEKALELDPLYARAFAGLADSYSILGNVKALPPGEAYPKAKTAAHQGLALDDSLGELHTSLGFIHRFWDWDWEAAEAAFRRAIELSPSYATTHRFYAQLLAGLGRFEEALPLGRKATELDPLSLLIRGAYADLLFYARRYDEAIAIYRETLEKDPDFLPSRTDLGRALELSGRYEEAIEQFQAAAALVAKGPPEPSSGLAHVYASMGRREDALAIVERILEIGKTRYVSPYGIASIYSCLGEVDVALDWLERAHAQHDQTLVWIKVHPRLDPLRDEPRFRAILEAMELA